MTWVTGSTGSPGHMVLGSLGRWVTKCDPVPCLVRIDKRHHAVAYHAVQSEQNDGHTRNVPSTNTVDDADSRRRWSSWVGSIGMWKRRLSAVSANWTSTWTYEASTQLIRCCDWCLLQVTARTVTGLYYHHSWLDLTYVNLLLWICNKSVLLSRTTSALVGDALRRQCYYLGLHSAFRPRAYWTAIAAKAKFKAQSNKR